MSRQHAFLQPSSLPLATSHSIRQTDRRAHSAPLGEARDDELSKDLRRSTTPVIPPSYRAQPVPAPSSQVTARLLQSQHKTSASPIQSAGEMGEQRSNDAGCSTETTSASLVRSAAETAEQHSNLPGSSTNLAADNCLPGVLPSITSMLVRAPLIRKIGSRPPTPNPDQDMLDDIEGDVHNAFLLMGSPSSPETHDLVRTVLLGLTARARTILMEGQGVRVCKQLEWLFEWEGAGGPTGEPLETLVQRITDMIDDEDNGGVWTRGKLFVNPADINEQPAPRSPESPLSPLTSLSSRSPSHSPSRSPSLVIPAPKRKQTTRKVTGRGRPKQTAQRSTGGKAPRKDMTSADDLVLPLQNRVVISPRPRSQSLGAMAEDSNLWCMSCLNGGKQLNCSLCPRALCFNCLPQLQQIDTKILEELEFRCTRCHIHDGVLRDTPYMGLYRGGVPFLKVPLEFVGPNINSASAQVDCRPLAILNFHLPSLGFQSPAAITVHAALTPFFLPTPVFDVSADLGMNCMDSDSDGDKMSVDPPATVSGLEGNKTPLSNPELANMTNNPIIPNVDPSLYMYRDIPFNLGTGEEMKRHKDNLAELVSDLKRFSPMRLLLFISTHSHPESGDPWVSELPECLPISNFFTYIFGNGLLEIIKNTSTTAFFLACGALTGSPKSRLALHTLTKLWSFDNVFAFGAPRFISSEPVGFILDFARKVIIQGFPVHTVLPGLLKGAESFGMHSSIIHIAADKFFEYRWMHPTLAPNGQRLALQCPSCHRLSSFGRPTVKNNLTVFRCTGSKNGISCDGVVESKLPAGFKELKLKDPQARWLCSKVDISELCGAGE